MENVATLQKSVDRLGASLSPLETSLNELMSNVDVAELSALEQAEYYGALTYALDSVIFAYLKSVGIDPKTHPISGELQRVKGMMGSLKKARGEKPITHSKIDKEAAARFIKHAIGSQSKSTTTGPDPKSVLEKFSK